MSWASYGDQFTRQAQWDHVSYEARWHYLALVEECVRAHRWDGRLPLNVARRASDVPDPDKAHTELERVGFAYVVADTVELPYIGHHIPPPGQRPDTLLPRKRENQAEYRRRRCERGEHSKDCPATTCPEKQSRRVTDRVAGNADAFVASNSESSRVETRSEEPEQNSVTGEAGSGDDERVCAGSCGNRFAAWYLDERGGFCVGCARVVAS